MDGEEVTRMARSTDELPPEVRARMPSREKRAASHAEVVAALEAIRRGDWSKVIPIEELDAELAKQDAADAADSS